jgi:hypothetical protein
MKKKNCSGFSSYLNNTSFLITLAAESLYPLKPLLICPSRFIVFGDFRQNDGSKKKYGARLAPYSPNTKRIIQLIVKMVTNSNLTW